MAGADCIMIVYRQNNLPQPGQEFISSVCGGAAQVNNRIKLFPSGKHKEISPKQSATQQKQKLSKTSHHLGLN